MQRMDWYGRDRRARCKDAQLSDIVVRADRCDQALLDIDGRLDLGAIAASDGDVQVVRNPDIQRRAVGFPHGHRGEPIARLGNQAGVEKREAVAQQGRACILAPPHVFRAQHHGNQAHAVAQRGADQAVARRIRMTGLQAIDRRVALEQAIAVLLFNAVVVKLPHRKPVVVLREVPDQRDREQRHVARGREMLRRGQAGAILEMGTGHAEALRFRIHQLRKGRFRSGDALGERNGCIIARLDNHAQDQFFHRHDLADFDEGARPFRAPGVFADRHGLIQLQLSRGELLEHDVGRHQLRQARRVHPRDCILGGQDLVGMKIDEDVRARIDLRDLRDDRGCGAALEREDREEAKGKKQARHIGRSPCGKGRKCTLSRTPDARRAHRSTRARRPRDRIRRHRARGRCARDRGCVRPPRCRE